MPDLVGLVIFGFWKTLEGLCVAVGGAIALSLAVLAWWGLFVGSVRFWFRFRNWVWRIK